MPAADAPLAVCPLASGSKGNAYWIEGGGTAILVDAGVSLRRLSRGAEEIGRRLGDVDHLFLTHEHTDHVRGLAMLLKRYRPVVWASRGTLRALRGVIPDGVRVRATDGRGQAAGAFRVTTARVSHDALDPVVYRFEADCGSAAVVTDLGRWDEETLEVAAGAEVLVCEANHDPEMLETGPYPRVIKRRIASPLGHLSNEEGALLAAEAVREGTRAVILAHLSEQNNAPGLAREVFAETLAAAGEEARIEVAAQRTPGPWVAAGPVREVLRNGSRAR